MQSSLLDRIFPPSSPLLPQHDHRSLQSPSSTTIPLARSAGFPPASSSSILQPALWPASLPHSSDPLVPIDRAAKSLQQTIQSLLDAQSEGLLAGLGSSNSQDEVSSNGSLTATPTVSSTTTSRKPATIPIRQPPQKKVSLQGARRGLSRAMQDFSALKQHEESILDSEIQERDDALHRVEAFRAKREGLQSEITSITSQSGAWSADRFRTEANELDAQIRELENQLFEMKARHRHLLNEAHQLENSVQSMLSSYNASLELLDKDINRFLTRPPIVQPSRAAVSQLAGGGGSADDGFYGMNPKRRTLEMASEHWRGERGSLGRRKEAIQREGTALDDGGEVWRQAVTEIRTLEQNLKGQMQKLSMDSTSQQERDKGIAAVLGNMDKTIEELERRLQEAEEKDWRLLICCIGAELEALREGREILLEASGLRGRHPQKENGLSQTEGRENSSDLTLSSPNELLLRQPTASAEEDDAISDHGPEQHRPVISESAGDRRPNRTEELPRNRSGTRSRTSSDSRSESEDDEPGPDFLISHT